MFRDKRGLRSYIAVVFTYTLDLVGYSIVFPVFAPLLLNPSRHFFAPDAPIARRTVAGPLAGWNIYFPLALGAILCALGFFATLILFPKRQHV